MMTAEAFIKFCLSGTPQQIHELIVEGIDVNAKGEYGWTALMHAALYNDSETVALLLRAGADANARNENGVTPLMCAISNTL